MAASTLNISIEQGADYIAVVTIKDSDGNEVDLTGSTFQGGLSASTQAKPVAYFNFEVLDQTSKKGQFKWMMTSSATKTIPTETAAATDKTFINTDYLYDIEWTDSGGVVTRLFRGKASVSPEVTK